MHAFSVELQLVGDMIFQSYELWPTIKGRALYVLQILLNGCSSGQTGCLFSTGNKYYFYDRILRTFTSLNLLEDFSIRNINGLLCHFKLQYFTTYTLAEKGATEYSELCVWVQRFFLQIDMRF